jgi:hypothetical protein
MVYPWNKGVGITLNIIRTTTHSTKKKENHNADASCRQINTLSNLFLSAKNGKVAAFAGTRESAQVAGKFFTTEYTGSGTISFHAGDDTHQLGLSGTNGLLSLVDLVNPSAQTIPKDKPTEWSVFQIGQGGDVTVKDGQNVPSRKWVTYLDTDGVYYVGLWDGKLISKYPR